MERVVHQVAISSGAFPADEIEGELINPGRFGMALAHWVQEELERAGLEPGTPVPEDWGWMVDVRGPGRVVVGCGNVDDEDDAFILTVENVPRRFRKPDPDAAALVTRAVVAIDTALRAHPGVTAIEWEQGGPTA